MTLDHLRTHILVVDDSEIDNLIFKLIIKKALRDLSITSYNNGRAALNWLIDLSARDHNLLPDYLFVDLNMPAMDGFEFVEEFHRLNIDPLGKCKIYILFFIDI